MIDDDPDAAFIFSWIAFNAAHAKDMGDDPRSFARANFLPFDGIVVAELLDNKHIFSTFWKFHNGDAQYDNWALRFENAKKAAHYAIEGQETAKLLSILFRILTFQFFIQLSVALAALVLASVVLMAFLGG